MLRIKNGLQGSGIGVEEVKYGQDGNLYFYGTLDFEKLSGETKNTFYKGLNKFEKTFFENMTKYCYVDFRDHYGGLKPEIRIIKNLSGAKYLKVLKGVRKKYVDLCMIVEKNIKEWYNKVLTMLQEFKRGIISRRILKNK